MVRNGFKGIFTSVLLMTGCILFIGGVSTHLKGQAIKSPGGRMGRYVCYFGLS